VYRSTSASVLWPVTLMISCGVALFRHAGWRRLRTPWGRAGGAWSACRHQSLNLLPEKTLAVNGFLIWSARTQGVAAIDAVLGTALGCRMSIGLRCSFLAWRNCSRALGCAVATTWNVFAPACGKRRRSNTSRALVRWVLPDQPSQQVETSTLKFGGAGQRALLILSRCF